MLPVGNTRFREQLRSGPGVECLPDICKALGSISHPSKSKQAKIWSNTNVMFSLQFFFKKICLFLCVCVSTCMFNTSVYLCICAQVCANVWACVFHDMFICVYMNECVGFCVLWHLLICCAGIWVCVHMHGCGCTMVHVLRSKDNLWEYALFVFWVGSWSWTQITGFGSRTLDSLS